MQLKIAGSLGRSAVHPSPVNDNSSNPIKIHGFQAHMGSMRSPSRGRVHGLEGLRVVAEKMADLIRGRSPLPRIEVPYYVAKGVAARR